MCQVKGGGLRAGKEQGEVDGVMSPDLSLYNIIIRLFHNLSICPARLILSLLFCLFLSSRPVVLYLVIFLSPLVL